MARRNADMDQDRRDAQAWALEWSIKRRNRRIIAVIAGIAAVALIGLAIDLLQIYLVRSTFRSEEEMRAAVQGRYEYDKYEDIEIIGDDVTLTYYEVTHYYPEYAERYGYSDREDTVYTDTVEEWDYRRGVIRCRWMDEIQVLKNGSLRYYSSEFRKTDKPKPEPFDPSILENGGDEDYDDGFTDDQAEQTHEDGEADEHDGDDEHEEGEAAENAHESLEATEEAAEEAGVSGEGSD